MTEKGHLADPKDLADVASRAFSWLGRDPHEDEHEPRVIIHSADGTIVVRSHVVSHNESWVVHEPPHFRERVIYKYGATADAGQSRREWSEEWLGSSGATYLRQLAAVFPTFDLPAAFLPDLPALPTTPPALPLPSPFESPSAAPTVVPDADLKEEFAELARRWRGETDMLSSLQRIHMNSAYQQIIGLGPAAVPLIIEELRDRPARWFWALTAITREDPAAQTKTFAEARSAWLDWAVAKHLIPPGYE